MTVWTLEGNTRARRFYEAHDFRPVQVESGDPLSDFGYSMSLC